MGALPGFSIYRGVGMLCMGWGVEELEFYLTWWFFLQSVSPESLQDFTLGITLSASYL
jgi:hypothetical protein